MNKAILNIGARADGSTELRFTQDNAEADAASLSPDDVSQAQACGRRIAAFNPGDGPETRALLAKEFSAHAVPESLARTMRQWALSRGGGEALCVRCSSGHLASLPWEILPEAIGVPSITVARLAGRHEAKVGPGEREMARDGAGGSAKVRMLAAGWSRLYGFPLPGIERELRSLPAILDQGPIDLTVVSEPTIDELTEIIARVRPEIVHLLPPGVLNRQGDSMLTMTDARGASEEVSVSRLVAALADQSDLSLIVINACDSGPIACGILTEHLGTTAMGWGGAIEDELATDFSLFFYRRLLERATVLGAVRAFMERDSLETATARPPAPLLWFPSEESIDIPVFPLGEEADRALIDRGSRSRSERPTGFRHAPPAATEVEIQFQPVPALNAALLKNGRPAIERLTLISGHELSNVRLEIQCDTGNGCSVVKQTLKLAAGSHPVSTDGIHFPILYELSRTDIGRRYVNFLVTVSVDDTVLAETTRAVLWMGPNEWMDQRETWPFIPAFVQPQNSGVRQIFGQAVTTLRTLGDPTESFDGYQRADREAVRRQIKAVFQTLRDEPFRLSYINPPSSPVYVPGSPSPAGQVVRFPKEIVEDKRGTCHDLSLLLASCAEHVQINSLVVIVPGHTFFGYWLDRDVHHDYWRERSSSARAPSFGASWTINSIHELRALLSSDAVEFVQATQVCNRNASFEEACAEGAGLVTARPEHQFDCAVDVGASRHAVQPV